jgi:hypothetical protein
MLFFDVIANIAALARFEWAKRQLCPTIYEMAPQFFPHQSAGGNCQIR